MFLLAADAPHPLDHVVDVIFLRSEGGLPLLTQHMVTLMISAVLTLVVMTVVARAMAQGKSRAGWERYLPKGRLAQVIEAVIVGLRDQMLVPILGAETTRRYLPFLLSLFFFIWFNNLVGLVPLLDLQHLLGGATTGNYHFSMLGGTATGNIAVTAALATVAFVVIQVHGFRELGVGGWAHHLLGGAPWWLAPLMVPIEIVGMIIKPAALAIRLFANMLAGHTLMATVLLFGFMALSAGLGWLVGGLVGVVSGAFAVAIYFLELFVATLQAFVFMFLTAVFIGQLSHHDDHEHEHADADGHAAHAHAAEPAAAH